MPVFGSLLELERRPLQTHHGRFEGVRFLDLARGKIAWVLARGDVWSPAPVLARVHSACLTSEVFGACDCDCADQLAAALAAIDREGRGLLFYLMQEGRGAGFVAKARDRMMVQASDERIHTFEAYERMGLPHDARSYREVAFALEALGVAAPLHVLTNNPDKVVGLEGAKIRIAGTRGLPPRVSPFNRHYLAAKSASGHSLGAPARGLRAPLPEAVVWTEGRLLADVPNVAHVASYLLPLRPTGADLDPPVWYRCHVYFDLVRGAERVVLELASGNGPRAVLRQTLTDRFPLTEPGPEAAAWRAHRAAIEAHGGGRALFLDPGETRVPSHAPALLARSV